MEARSFVRRFLAEANDDRVLGLAAEAAFFAVLSLFPGLVIAASMLGLLDVIVGAEVAARAQESVISALDTVLTDAASGAISSVERLFERTRGDLLTLGLVGGAVSLSGAFAVVINALNIVYDTVERRSWVRRRILGLAMGVSTIVVATCALAVIVVGPLLGEGAALADMIGLGDAFAFSWNVLRLPVLLLGVFVWAAALFRYAPSRRTGWRDAVPGALLTTVLWLVATGAFHLYLRIAAGSNPLIGAFGGGVIVMMWIYLLSLALLLGAELNATVRAYAMRTEP